MEIPDLKQLLEAGCHFGHQVRRANPKMAPYIYQARDNIHIIDLVQTRSELERACEFVKKQAALGKVILFVGTKKQAQDIIRDQAERVDAPYLTKRWVGGFLTNFDVIFKNLEKLRSLRKKLADLDYLEKITKKEKAILEKTAHKLEANYNGVMSLEKLPDVLFIVDAHKEELAVHEAGRIGIPIVAICDTNANPMVIDYPIPSNDDAGRAIKLLVKTIADAVFEGKTTGEKVEVAVESTKEVEKTAKKPKKTETAKKEKPGQKLKKTTKKSGKGK